jgi:zinc protease
VRADYESVLENNFRSFIAEQPLLQMVQITLFIKSPEIYEPAGKEGISALTANLIRSGAEGLSSNELNSELNRLGASLESETGRNGVRFKSVAPVDSYDEMIQLLSRMIVKPDFISSFDREQTRYAAQVNRELENAAMQARALFEKELYGELHRYGRRATTASVNNITAEDIESWYGRYYHAGNMTLAVSGAVNKISFEEAIKQSDFSVLKPEVLSHESTERVPGLRDPDGINVVTKNIATRQGHIMLGHAGIEGIPEDHAALEVMHHILAGGGFISRMMELLRTQTGITSALFGEIEPGLDTPNPYLWRFSGNPETLLEGVTLALAEIRKMHENGLTMEEFEAARTAFLDGLIPGSYETPQKTAERMAHKALYGLYPYQSPQYLNYYAGSEEQMDALRQLTLEDVNRAAKKYLDPDNMIITISGPMDDIMESVTDEARLMLGL